MDPIWWRRVQTARVVCRGLDAVDRNGAVPVRDEADTVTRRHRAAVAARRALQRIERGAWRPTAWFCLVGVAALYSVEWGWWGFFACAVAAWAFGAWVECEEIDRA